MFPKAPLRSSPRFPPTGGKADGADELPPLEGTLAKLTPRTAASLASDSTIDFEELRIVMDRDVATPDLVASAERVGVELFVAPDESDALAFGRIGNLVAFLADPGIEGASLARAFDDRIDLIEEADRVYSYGKAFPRVTDSTPGESQDSWEFIFDTERTITAVYTAYNDERYEASLVFMQAVSGIEVIAACNNSPTEYDTMLEVELMSGEFVYVSINGQFSKMKSVPTVTRDDGQVCVEAQTFSGGGGVIARF